VSRIEADLKDKQAWLADVKSKPDYGNFTAELERRIRWIKSDLAEAKEELEADKQSYLEPHIEDTGRRVNS
tara:strand:+ start:766 stop:978 length:213 start_codon:yes stop_codon:yes gene_type:complete